MHFSLLHRTAAMTTAVAAAMGLMALTPAAADDLLPRFRPAHAQLTADGLAEDHLGNAVAIDGDTAVVGAYLADVDGIVNRGAAYVYERSDDGWALEAILAPDEDDIGLLFGGAVAVDGDTAVVGAVGSYVDGTRSGAAFVFVRDDDGWRQQAKLAVDSDQWGAEFGRAVALQGDTAVIGAPFAHVGDTNVQGMAYVFGRDGETWSEQGTLVAADGSFYEYFGMSVGLDAGTAVIGAPGATVDGVFRRGAAYVFTRGQDGWAEETKLDPSDGVADIEFGAGVDIDGETVLIGAGGPDLDGWSVHGAGYVFSRADGSWTEQAKLTPIDGQPGDRFGRSVALDAGIAVIGASRHGSETGVDLEQGTAVVFTQTDGEWVEDATLSASAVAPGDHLGSAVAVDGDVALVGAPDARVGDHSDQGAAYVFNTTERAPLPPRIEVKPTGVEALLAPNKRTTSQLTVGNAGEEDLRWEVADAGAPAGILRPAGDATVVDTPARKPSGPAPSTGANQMATDATPALARDGHVSDAEASGAVSGHGLAADETVTTLTHSVSMEITPGNTLVCTSREDGTTRENHALRTFTLPDFGVDGAFDVTEVTFGIERISHQADLAVNLYTLEGPLTYVNLRRIASEVVTLEPQEAELVTVPMTARVPSGATLVMEVVAPDMEGIGGIYFGSNSVGETAPSYTSSEPCGARDPITYASVGGGHVHLVMAVHGTSVEPLSCELPDWLAVSPAAGTLTGGDESVVDVRIDTAGLDTGEHTAHLCFSSNDPRTPMTTVPVVVTVEKRRGGRDHPHHRHGH